MGEGGAGADADARLTSSPGATVVYVVFGNDSIDLSWIPSGAAEVLVVHNDGEARTSAEGAALDIVHLVPPGNLGFGAGVNLAAEHASRHRLLLVNPDTRLAPEHWTALTHDVDEDDVVTIPLIDDKGVMTYSVRPYPTPIVHLLGGFRVGRLAPRSSRLRASPALPTHEQAFALSTHWASGAALSLPIERFRRCGGFDPAFFLYYEDVDLCARMATAFSSMQVRLRSTTPGIHTVGASGRRSREVERIRLESAIEWSRRQRGLAWRVVERLLRGRLAGLRP